MSHVPAPPMNNQLKARAGLVVGSFAVGLILCEVFLRLFAPQVTRRPPVWGYDQALGWRHIAGASGRMVSPEFDVHVHINSDGLRDREYDVEKPPDVRRILVFGDSFAEGWGVPVERTFSEKLENNPGRGGESNPPIQVLNFGVAGFGTDQELLLFRRHGTRYLPDDVVVLFYANDLWNNQSHKGIGSERGHKPYFRISGAGELMLRGVPVEKSRYWSLQEGAWPLPAAQRFQRYLFEHWHTLAIAGKALRSSPVPAAQQAKYYEGLYGRTETARDKTGWGLTGAILREFQQAVVAMGARFHLVYVPAIVQVEEENWRLKQQLHGLSGEDFDLQKPNRQLRAIATEHQISFVDLTPTFVAEARTRTLYFRDSHWNEAGHALAAEVVAGEIGIQ
jgi:hypothetical protein